MARLPSSLEWDLIFPDDNWTPASDLLTFTDASSKIGYGANCKKNWFCGAWHSHLQGQPIQWKELFTIYLACAVWVTNWASKKLIFKTDNVAIWSAQSSKSKYLMDLARKIFLLSATHNFLVKFQHIPGSNNPIADALSRLQMRKFRELAPRCKAKSNSHPRTPVSTLMSRLKAFKKAALAPSTRRIYNIGRKKFYMSCKNFNFMSFPLKEEVLCLFATNLAESVSFKTLKLYLSAVKFQNIELGLIDSMSKMTQLQLTLRGIKRT